MNVKTIGTIQSPFKKRFGTPRQGNLTPSTKAFIAIDPEFRNGLDGIEEFSHLWVISHLHQSEEISKMKIRPPRLRGEKRGIFSTRGPHRPNPIGLSLVKIEEVTPHGIWVSGIDLLDRTPVIDLKPFIARYDFASDSKSPEWIELPTPVNVIFEESFEESLNALNLSKDRRDQLYEMVRECLQYDPRPLAYLKRPSEVYHLEMDEFVIEVLNEREQFTVKKIEFSSWPFGSR